MKEEKGKEEGKEKEPRANYDLIFRNSMLSLSEFILRQKKIIGDAEIIKPTHLPDKIPRVDAREIDAFFVCENVDEKNRPVSLIHIEYQTDDDPRMLRRMQQYQSRILMQIEAKPELQWMKGLPIQSLVIYAGQKESRMENKVPSSQVFTGFELVELRNIPYNEFLKSSDPGVVTLAVLGDFQDKNLKKVAVEITKDLETKTHGNSSLLTASLRNLHNFSNLRNLGLTKIIKKLADKMIKLDEKKDLFYLKGKEAKEKEIVFIALSKGIKPELIKELAVISDESFKAIEKEWKAQQAKKEKGQDSQQGMGL